MLRFILKRSWQGLFIIFGVVTFVFLLFHALPGDPVSMIAGQRSDVSTRQEITRELGLDKPLAAQYTQFINDLLPISLHKNTPDNAEKYGYIKLFRYENERIFVLKRPYLRRSFQTNRRVDDILISNIPDTFWLAFAALAFATVLGISLGIIAALNHSKIVDKAIIGFSVLGISIPSYVLAILMALIFGYYLSHITGLELTGQLWQTHPIHGRQLHLKNIILPAITLGFMPLAIITQLTRNSMIEVFNQDFVKTARAKGLSKFRIIVKHCLRNALNPVLTAISGWMASLMAGAFFVEYIFDWKGIGYITIKAVQSLDFPVVMGSVIFIAIAFVLINIFADVLYAVLDPRVRLK